MKHIFFLFWLGLSSPASAQPDSLTADFFAQLRPRLVNDPTLISKRISIDCSILEDPIMKPGDAIIERKANARSREDIDTLFLFLPGEKDIVLRKLCAQNGTSWDNAPIADSLPQPNANNRQSNGYFELPVLQPSGSGPATLYVSKPVFFRQQQFALFAFSSFSGARNAYGAISIYENRNGKWIRIADLTHWVS
ncbi:MAG: hypothetical protein WBP58_03530 [Chitinophagaceae bacterium]